MVSAAQVAAAQDAFFGEAELGEEVA